MSYLNTVLNTTMLRTVAIITAVMLVASIVSVPQFAKAVDDTSASADINVLTGTDKLISGGIKLGQRDLRETVAQIINVALSLLGVIAVVVVIIGGFFWMTAGGNEEQVGKAKGWIFSGIIGLAIILSAFAISKFVIEQLGAATNLGV